MSRHERADAPIRVSAETAGSPIATASAIPAPSPCPTIPVRRRSSSRWPAHRGQHVARVVDLREEGHRLPRPVGAAAAARVGAQRGDAARGERLGEAGEQAPGGIGPGANQSGWPIRSYAPSRSRGSHEGSSSALGIAPAAVVRRRRVGQDQRPRQVGVAGPDAELLGAGHATRVHALRAHEADGRPQASQHAEQQRAGEQPPIGAIASRCRRAIVRQVAAPKPRASMAVASRVARRTEPTRSASSIPKASRAAATGDPSLLTPRARRAMPRICHSTARIGSIRTAASTPIASRGERRACCWRESARSVGSVLAMASTPERAIPSRRSPSERPRTRSGPARAGRRQQDVEHAHRERREQQRPRPREQVPRRQSGEGNAAEQHARTSAGGSGPLEKKSAGHQDRRGAQLGGRVGAGQRRSWIGAQRHEAPHPAHLGAGAPSRSARSASAVANGSVMGDEADRHAGIAQRGEQVEQLDRGSSVLPEGRLVEDQDRWLDDQRGRDREAALLAARRG